MKIITKDIECNSRSFRLEIFPFGDCHIGKRNCAEEAIKKQVAEILKRDKMDNRSALVICGGDLLNSISPADVRRFDFNELADWFVSCDADETRERLGNMAMQEVERAAEIFKPIQHLIIGGITGNHEGMMKKHNNINVHKILCKKLGMVDLTDESIVVLRFKRTGGDKSTVKLYIRHGYGGGRTAGAEPMKLARMLDEWEDMDVCLTGHSHTFSIIPPKPVLFVTERTLRLEQKYRFAANWGCWLYSHLIGPGSYESSACYPARPLVTFKIVIWPFWSRKVDGVEVKIPKIELRQYPIL